MIVSDYSAELYVAGRFADAGWNVYFPHRDMGFDFMISKPDKQGWQLIRPVQVKGKYPTTEKGDKAVYGYVGGLTVVHPEMVLAIPYFSNEIPDVPLCIAYMPFSQIKSHIRGYRCEPSSFKLGKPVPRPGYSKFFGPEGLRLLEDLTWKDTILNSAAGNL
jgi:hypothetical protein